MRVIEKTLYKFAELSNEAQEKAIERLRNNGDLYVWQDDDRATLKESERIFPVKVKAWEYGYQCYINFTVDCDSELGELKGVRLATYIWNNYKDWLYKGRYYSKGDKSRRSKILLDKDYTLTGYCRDYDILKPLYDFMEKPCKFTDFDDLMRECLEAWVHACNKDFEYTYSDEAIRDMIECNEYEFDVSGNLY